MRATSGWRWNSAPRGRAARWTSRLNKLDAAIIFAPAGEIVPAALRALRKGGTLVLGGIHMSPIPSFDYDLLYQERVIRSVANNTRRDGEEFLRTAAEIPIRTHVEVFPLREAESGAEQPQERRHPGGGGAASRRMTVFERR